MTFFALGIGSFNCLHSQHSSEIKRTRCCPGNLNQRRWDFDLSPFSCFWCLRDTKNMEMLYERNEPRLHQLRKWMNFETLNLNNDRRSYVLTSILALNYKLTSYMIFLLVCYENAIRYNFSRLETLHNCVVRPEKFRTSIPLNYNA